MNIFSGTITLLILPIGESSWEYVAMSKIVGRGKISYIIL